ncbi:hypothetical protein [Streptomyces sp. CAI-85]|uniref:hypothetical protein n=1 Tax=Streptomyces sp. CAI-85 TaxID=1472662 RepID=UPI0020CA8BC5|nr:hypothetical protein [Streptomyces sp. CAI-85]
MWGKLFGGDEERPADPYALPVSRKDKRNGVYKLRALGDTRVLAMVEAARAGHWEELKTASAPFDLGRDHQVLGELAEIAGVEYWIGGAAEADEEHRATALLISGARHIVWGWEARTSARASEVSQEQWRTFHQRLHIAEEHLLEAAELRPEWVAPWRRLLTSGRGMSLGTAVNEARLDAALRREPLDLETHIEWVSQLQPRWHGEPGAALEFARKAFAQAPDGHRLGCVIPMARVGGSENRRADRRARVHGPYAGGGDRPHPEVRGAAAAAARDRARSASPGFQGQGVRRSGARRGGPAARARHRARHRRADVPRHDAAGRQPRPRR